MTVALAPAAAPTARLSDRDLQRLMAVVHRHAGIALGPEKRVMIEARLAKLARRSTRSLSELISAAEAEPEGPVMNDLLDVLTTNYTSFFREPAHFAWLADTWLPAMVRRRKPLRVWCAAAATGEEPYSLAITLREGLERAGVDLPLELWCTDVSRRALAVAVAGVYPAGHVQNLDPMRRRRWFRRGVGDAAGRVRVSPELAKVPTFARHNLLDPPPWSSVDLIFLRNVMIYFDDATQARLLATLHGALAPDGFLVVGHAENVRRLVRGFRMHGHSILEKQR
jgi:chemotaxis protein methyltransferase CheR